MKKQYTQPELYVENVVVESGIATSLDFGIQSVNEVTGDDEGTWAF